MPDDLGRVRAAAHQATPYRWIPAGYLKAGVVVAVLWTLVLLVLLALTGEGVVRVAAVVGGLFTAIGAIFQQRRFPTVSRRLAVPVTAVVLLVDALSSVGWAGWTLYQANRPIDVTADVTLDHNIDVLPGGHATVDVDVSAVRNAIVLVFAASDHNGEIGSCVPNTKLSVTPDTGGNPGATQLVTPGDPLSVPLPSHARHVRLDVVVQNVRDDGNCGVDVAVSSAKLTNG